jgi:hypothetical protein
LKEDFWVEDIKKNTPPKLNLVGLDAFDDFCATFEKFKKLITAKVDYFEGKQELFPFVYVMLFFFPKGVAKFYLTLFASTTKIWWH